MFERVLVFLDGSEQSEIILPYVEQLSRRFKSELSIVSVSTLQYEHPFERLLIRYLNYMANQLKDRGAGAKPVFLRGSSVQAILKYADESDATLIAMVAHGGVGSTWVGIIAEKLIRESARPLLLVSGKGKQAESREAPALRRILVPLDLSKVGAVALPSAKELALGAGAELVLLHVIPFDHKVSGPLGKAASFQAQLVATLQEQARECLSGVSARFEAEKVKAAYDIVKGVPADTIMEYARQNAIDLIAMSTHGRTGLGRFVLGSVADKVVHASDLPVLLVRAQPEQTASHQQDSKTAGLDSG